MDQPARAIYNPVPCEKKLYLEEKATNSITCHFKSIFVKRTASYSFNIHLVTTVIVFNNYSSKWRWLVVDLYQAK